MKYKWMKPFLFLVVIAVSFTSFALAGIALSDPEGRGTLLAGLLALVGLVSFFGAWIWAAVTAVRHYRESRE